VRDFWEYDNHHKAWIGSFGDLRVKIDGIEKPEHPPSVVIRELESRKRAREEYRLAKTLHTICPRDELIWNRKTQQHMAPQWVWDDIDEYGLIDDEW